MGWQDKVNWDNVCLVAINAFLAFAITFVSVMLAVPDANQLQASLIAAFFSGALKALFVLQNAFEPPKRGGCVRSTRALVAASLF